jgi:hypothetical protein
MAFLTSVTSFIQSGQMRPLQHRVEAHPTSQTRACLGDTSWVLNRKQVGSSPASRLHLVPILHRAHCDCVQLLQFSSLALTYRESVYMEGRPSLGSYPHHSYVSLVPCFASAYLSLHILYRGPIDPSSLPILLEDASTFVAFICSP